MRIYVCTLLLKFDANPKETVTACGHGDDLKASRRVALFNLFDDLKDLKVSVVYNTPEYNDCIDKIHKASAMPANEAVEMLRTINGLTVAEFYNVV